MITADGMVGGRCGRCGPGAARLVAALALVLLVLGATAGAAGATDNPKGPKQTFIKNCKDSGGSVQEYTGEMEGVVQCTHVKDGTITTVGCEFTGPYLWVCGASQQPDSHGTPIRTTGRAVAPNVRVAGQLQTADDDDRE
jgi:hypothetical protein